MLTIKNLSKSYGRTAVLNDISLEVAPGEVVLLLGSNGAGKSTLLRTCAGLIRKDSGSLTEMSARSIGYVGHQALLYGALTLEENISLFGSLLGVSFAMSEQLEFWELTPHRLKHIDSLSQGLRARASLLRAFLGRPQFLFLDEPTSALDDRGLSLLISAIENNRTEHSGKTVTIIATHDIARTEDIATRVVVLKDGTLAYEGSGTLKAEAITRYRNGNR